MNSPSVSQDGGRRRRTIAVLLDYMTQFVGGYEGQIRSAFDEVCTELDLDLLLVYGHTVGEPHPWTAAHNAVFELLGPDSVDGIVALTSSIGQSCSRAALGAYLARYRALPLCSLGFEVPGVPSLLVDNRLGMTAVLEHLIDDHGRRRIAFIGGTPGHPDAEVRFEVYREVLAARGLAFDAALVAHGDFQRHSAYEGMEAILARNAAFDAVVAASDAMALSVVDVLREHGRRVPLDVAVTGFDDIVMARLASPPMTTVAQPFKAMASRSIQVLIARMEARDDSGPMILPAELVVRNSCGCTSRAHRHRSAAMGSEATSAAQALRGNAEAVLAELAGTLCASDLDGARTALKLVDALQRELDGKPGTFLEVLDDLLERTGDEPERCHTLQRCVTCLRERLRSHGGVELEDLWHDARELIALFGTRGQVRRRNQIDTSYNRLLRFGEQLVSSALDVPSLKASLARSLPAAGVQSAWLSRFPDDTRAELEPFLTMLGGVATDAQCSRFPASLLVPPGMCPRIARQTRLVFPLVCETQNLGLAVFDYEAGGNGYPMIRDQIGAALRTVNLHQEVVLRTMLHERSVQERAATAKRMQALSVLAGGVAHDLNNALGPLVGLPDIMVRELDASGAPEQSTSELRQDLRAIQTGTQRAAQTIKDLLTLSRQGRTTKAPLDLNRTIEDYVAVNAFSERNRGVRVVFHPAPEPLVVRGSEAHVGRAVANLVRNAVEAVATGGEVRVETSRLDLLEAIAGYETVEPGEYAVVTVSDDGPGIPTQDLSWVFEPFTSRKPASENSGLGLAIVHGVVKDHEGFVDVTSTVGVGTTFKLFFPRIEASLRPPAVQPTAPPVPARILVVDDELIQLRTARRLLTHLGYQVHVVSSGREALRLFADAASSGKSPYDLVLLDMMLNEEQDGLQVFAEIQRTFPSQKAIVVSGHAPGERAERALAEGLGWLAKPYTMDGLATAICATLMKASAEPEPITSECVRPDRRGPQP